MKLASMLPVITSFISCILKKTAISETIKVCSVPIGDEVQCIVQLHEYSIFM